MMNKDNGKIVSNSAILYVKLLITSVAGLVFTRIVLQNLGVENYGIYTVVGGIVMLMGFINTVMLSVTNRFIAYELGKKENCNVNKVFNVSLTIHIFIAFLVVLIGLPLGEFYISNYINVPIAKIEETSWVLVFSILGSAISFVGVPYNGLIVAQEKFVFFAIAEIISSFLRLLVAVSIVFFENNVLVLFSCFMALSTALPSILYFFYCRINFESYVKIKLEKKVESYKEMFSFSVWVAYGAFASIGKAQGANLMINYFFGAMLNAAIGIATSVNRIVILFAQGVGKAISPQITKSYAAGNIKRTEDLVIAASKYSFFLICLPSLPLLLNVELILSVWLGVVPDYTAIFIRLMVIDALIGALNAGVPEAIFASGKIKLYQLFVNSIFLTSLPIAFLFLRNGSSPEMLYITFIAISIVALVVRQIILYFTVQFNTRRLLIKSYLPALTIVCAMIPFLFLRDFLNEYIYLFAAEVYMVILMYFIGFTKNQRLTFIATLKKYIFSRKGKEANI